MSSSYGNIMIAFYSIYMQIHKYEKSGSITASCMLACLMVCCEYDHGYDEYEYGYDGHGYDIVV